MTARAGNATSYSQHLQETQNSQNSAPVHEFRCLFTHDLHKKQKKWHDGTLKFHTFNQRVMVYDDGKNFIGDLHYRQHDVFAEGLEIQLDKPVKVVVEERLETTSTNLSSVLLKRQDDPPPPTRAQLPRINASSSRLKPKSIKELLGNSQRTIGRAQLPTLSPFELRQATRSTPVQEPPAKKPRLSTDKENSPPRRKTPVDGSRAGQEEPLPPATVKQPRVVDVSSDDDTVASGHTATSTPHIQRSTSKRPTTVPAEKDSSSKRPTTIPLETQVVAPKPVARLALKATTPRLVEKMTTKTSRTDELRQSIANIPGPAEKTATLPPRPSGPHLLDKPQPSISKSLPRASKLKTVPSNNVDATRSTSVSTARNTSRFSSSGPRSPLTFAPPEKRPKLRYRALMQGQSHSNPDLTASNKNSDGCTENNSTNLKRPPRRSLIELDELFATQTSVRASISQPGPQSPVRVPEEEHEIIWDEVIADNARSNVDLLEVHAEIIPSSQPTEREPSLSKKPANSITINSSPMFVPHSPSQHDSPAIRRSTPKGQPFPEPSQVVLNRDFGLSSVKQDNAHFAALDRCVDQGESSSDEENESEDDFRQDRIRTIEAQKDPESHKELDHQMKDVEDVEAVAMPSDSSPPPSPFINAQVDNRIDSPPLSPTINAQVDHRFDSESPEIIRVLPSVTSKPVTRMPPPATPKRPFKRVLSEPTSLLESPKSTQIRTQAKGAMLPPSRRSAEKSSINLPIVLEKAVSDPSGIEEADISSTALEALVDSTPFILPHQKRRNTVDQTDPASEEPPANSEATEEQGPWTSVEAFLLFNRWPPNRVKPDYGQSAADTGKEKRIAAGRTVGTKLRVANAASARSNEPSIGMAKSHKYGSFGSARLVSQR